MGAMSPELSIVIPCFNGVDYTAACLESIVRNTPEAHEVILVDNGSTDGTADVFARTWSGDGALVRNQRNAGFGIACNQGLAVVRGDVAMVLNNDTLVTPGWSTALLAALRRDPAIGVAVPRSNHVGGDQMVYEVGYRRAPGPEMDEFGRDRAERLAGRGRLATRVSGLCMAIPRDILEAVGGFDPVFRLGNFEDDDYSLRVRMLGRSLWICDDSFIHHFGHRTFAMLPEEYDDLLAENGVRFAAKWDIAPAVERDLPRLPERPFDPRRARVALRRWAPAATRSRWPPSPRRSTGSRGWRRPPHRRERAHPRRHRCRPPAIAAAGTTAP